MVPAPGQVLYGDLCAGDGGDDLSANLVRGDGHFGADRIARRGRGSGRLQPRGYTGATMKLGTRVTVVTTVLVAPVLAASGYAALKLRRADLEADLDRQAREVAETLRSGLEPVSDDTEATTRVLTERAWMSRERDDAFKLEVLRVGDRWQTTDQSWLILAQAAEIEDGPVGNLLEAPGREPAFAMAVPLQDLAGMALPQHHPARK